jgi:peroxiredoxin family protein
MKKFFLFVILYLTFIQYSKGQIIGINKAVDTTSLSKSTTNGKAKMVYFKTWGLQKLDNHDYESCRDSLQLKYGFKNRVVSGCVVTSNQVRRWTKYNNKMEKQMIERNGVAWREKYELELETCRNKYQ